MGGAREQVHGDGPLDQIAQGAEAGEIPGQGGRVAGDIDDTGRGHGGGGFHHVGGQALSGRVHADDVGPQALGGQAAGGLSRVAAEETGVGDPVARGVLPGVLHRLGYDLRTDDLPGPGGHGEADGPDPAVEIQQNFPPGEAGKLRRFSVENLGLIGVDLVEGGDGEPEGEPAQQIVQIVLSPERPVGVPQNDVIALLVDAQQNPGEAGLRRTEGLHQFGLPGDLLPVDQKAEQRFPPPVGADIDMPDQPLAAALLIGGNVIAGHPGPRGGAEPGGRFALEKAVLHIGDSVGPGLIKADFGPVGHGELGLVPVAKDPFRTQDLQMGQRHPSNALQSLLYAGAFGLQLLGIGHVAEAAPAAVRIVGTIGLGSGGRGRLHPDHMAPGGGTADLVQIDPAGLPPDGPFDKDHLAVAAGHAGAVGGVALDGHGEGGVFL